MRLGLPNQAFDRMAERKGGSCYGPEVRSTQNA